MPKIQDAFGKICVQLPSYGGSEVAIKTAPTVEEIMGLEKVEGEMERAVLLASKMILSWNFTDVEDKPVPVTSDAIKQLPTADLEFLLETITPLVEKKSLSPNQ